MKSIVLSAGLLLISSNTMAAENLIGHKITRLATGWGGEGFYVDSQGAVPAAANCGDGSRMVILNQAPMQKEMISLLLTAAQNKTPTDLYVDGCYGGRMILKAVASYPAS